MGKDYKSLFYRDKLDEMVDVFFSTIDTDFLYKLSKLTIDEVFSGRLSYLMNNYIYDYCSPSFSNSDMPFKVEYGCSRICLVPLDEQIPYIIKFEPMNNWDEEALSFNERETTLYKEAEGEGLSHFFTKVGFYKTYYYDKNLCFELYCSEKVKCEDGLLDSECSDATDDFVSTYEATTALDVGRNGCQALIDAYGENEVAKLFTFLIDNDIDDVHNNNFGINAEGKPVIFDYAGFDQCIIENFYDF